MKKRFIYFIILAIIFLTSCENENKSTVNASEESIEPLNTTIVGGRVGGSWSVFAEGIAESIRRENEGAIITVEPGGIVENPLKVATGLVPYGLSYAMTSYAAYTGEEPYDQPYKDIRAVSVVIPGNYYQFVVSEDVPYHSFEEMAQQQAPIRLAVDQKGTAGEIITRKVLQEYGISYEDILSWGGSVDYLSGSKTFEMMADNRIDATGDAVSAPSSDIIEASTIMNLKILPLSEEVIQGVSEELDMNRGTIDKSSYSFLQEDVETVSTPAILIAHKDASMEEVYQITEAIYENLDYLRTVHSEFKNLSMENMMNVGNVPLHPGAEKFYREKGMLP
ncbi:TAXI family TRAP transporter solute-binding subunit [Oceanobacillus piezotolerans]|uniref:TAXI family TRAP transporter solute-binding subunit n=1 Tax=Oceanobacillus piezotolerans TaxID=2448030 RepID=A0A498DGE1_9BACI|nr:TAXI family TRAP transporter solute-binding subunit [Oceanobacillus piezotolerans]RLL47011.1 TAXI family TRAP transporter solute-binding subunit [Oceanobacillus piezotolerans]